MKHPDSLPRWTPWVVASLILAGSGSVGRAADPISYTFDSDAQGWYAADGHGTVTFDPANGVGGGGCLKATLLSTDTEVDPRVDVAFSSAEYLSVSMDVRVDVASGADAGGLYGNLQAVLRNASWSWGSLWYGGVDTVFNDWQHVSFTIVRPYDTIAHLQVQLQGAAPYSGDVILYLDNIRVTPLPNPWMLNAFTNAESVTAGVASWVGGSPSADGIAVSWNTDRDAGGGLTPTGSLQMVVGYNEQNTGWQEGVVQMTPFDWDPARFAYLDFDLYLDGPAGLSTYGVFQLFLISPTWDWSHIDGVNLNAGMIGKWTHCSFPLAGSGLTNSHGWIFQAGGGVTQPLTYCVDNIKVWKPVTLPTITQLEPGSVGGVRITMDQDGAQWQRDAICSPASPGDCLWTAYATPETPVTYSFTITNFPDALAHPGFSAHLFLVNGDTAGGSYNETQGGCDWNAADVAIMRVENGNAGGVLFSFSWKTNMPNANPLDASRTTIWAPSALGTWSVSFTSATEGTLNGPDGVTTNFTLPAEAAANFTAFASFLQFGMFKNDGANDGHNNQQSGTFSRIQKTGGDFVFDDSFGGPGLTANYAWRVSSATAVRWIPADTAYWLTWTTPDDGFSVEATDDLMGSWPSAGVTYTYAEGANRVGAIPSGGLPPGATNSCFFRLARPF